MNNNTLALLAAWTAIVVALFVVWLQNRTANRLMGLQLFMQIAAQYDSENMQKIRAALAAQLLTNPTTLDINDSLLVFYENIALLERRKLLNSDLMFNTFGLDVCGYWSALRHYVKHIRGTFGVNLGVAFYLEFEQLNDRFAKKMRSRGGEVYSKKLSEVSMTPENLKDFLQLETLRGRERIQPNNLFDRGAG